MSPAAEIALAIAAGPPLWLCGAIVFDAVHWVLHRMLASRWRWLRTLAWPHAVHHAWIDEDLEIHWDVQRRNVWCHIVPEYATQLVFTALLFLVLPPVFPLVVGGLQTAVFLGILRARGLDRNHRPIRLLDAYAPGLHTPPAYHALHHAHPDAYFSAYTKGVDLLAGSGAQLRGRRFAIRGGDAFADALAAILRREGAGDVIHPVEGEVAELADLDVLVLCDPAEAVQEIEAFVDATRERLLPPEVWVAHPRGDDPTARHYHRDVRVSYRTLVVAPEQRRDPATARHAARRLVGRIRRGAHFVPAFGWLQSLAALRRFRRTEARPPAQAERLRHRADILA